MEHTVLTPLQQALDVIEQLSVKDQETLIEIVQRRLVEQRRKEIARNASVTLQAFREGRASYGTVDDSRREPQVKVQQGIWIDEQAIRDAGLGSHLRIVVQPGEIRILSLLDEAELERSSKKGWDVFRSLGRDAQPGRLPNAAAEHDGYLYGKGQ